MNTRRWKRSLLIAAVGLLIGKTPLFAQQTDPALTSAVLGQTAALKKIHKDRKKTQEKIIAGSGSNRFTGADSPCGRQDAGLPFECAGRHAEPLPD